MTTKKILSLSLLGLLATVPVFAFAQTGVDLETDTNVRVNTRPAALSASTTVSARLDANAEKARERAGREIDRRIESLQKLSARIKDMARVSDTLKTTIAANTDMQVKALAELKTKIESDQDLATLKTDVKSVTESYRIYALVVPQGRITAAADRIAHITIMMQSIGSKLQARIEAAATAGADVSTASAALQRFADKISLAQAKAQAAVTAVVDLQPDQGDKVKREANAKALKQAQADIKAAHQALADGRKEVATILKFLGSSGAGASASTTASTSVRVR